MLVGARDRSLRNDEHLRRFQQHTQDSTRSTSWNLRACSRSIVPCRNPLKHRRNLIEANVCIWLRRRTFTAMHVWRERGCRRAQESRRAVRAPRVNASRRNAGASCPPADRRCNRPSYSWNARLSSNGIQIVPRDSSSHAAWRRHGRWGSPRRPAERDDLNGLAKLNQIASRLSLPFSSASCRTLRISALSTHLA